MPSQLDPFPSSRVRIHYRRPPDREEIFEQALILDRPDVKITFAQDMELDRPKRISGRTVLESGSSVVWFTFPGAWHDIGRFHAADGRFTGIYANILTPVELRPQGVWVTTDLYLDIWLEPDGAVQLLDVEQLEEAVQCGILDPALAERAREEADRILEAVSAGTWPPRVVREWTLRRARQMV